EVPHGHRAAQSHAVQHAPLPRTAADADLEPRLQVAPGCGASRARGLPLLRGEAGQAASLLHSERSGVSGLRSGARLRSAPVISGETRLVGLIGSPVSVSRSLSPRMHNAAFAA